MRPTRSPRLAFAAAALALAACGDSPTGPRDGTVTLAVTTTGRRPDPDGYLVSVDSGAPQAVPSNGAVSLGAFAPGRHVLRVSGAAVNCALAADSLDAEVTAGGSASVALSVSCPRVLSNEILLASEEFGFSELLVMKPDGTGRERITADQQVNVMPSASPDGRQLVFVSRQGGGWGLYVMNADSAVPHLLVARSSLDGEPAWSPDGRTIAFRSGHQGPYGTYGRIWLVDSDGTNLRQLSPHPADTTVYAFDDKPTWSPDSRKVAFGRSGELYVINADGTGLTQLTQCPLACDSPAWSPDGQRIAYSTSTDLDGDRVADAHFDVYVMNADGTDPRRLTADPAQEWLPEWSPDGTQIVFTRVVDGFSQIFRVSADGGEAVRISLPGRHDGSPDWVPAHQW